MESALRYWKANAALIALLFLSASAQELERQGELRIYPRETQIGTVALREFKNEKGSVVKIIFYTQLDLSARPFREELLREQSIRTFDYDEHNCNIKTQSYEPPLKLIAVDEVRCFEGTATPSLTTRRSSHGVREAEIRHTSTGSRRTVLFFDHKGEKVVSIVGELPTDTDLANGWGAILSGFAAGIASSREKGRQKDLQLLATIKNVNNNDEGVMIAPIRIELTDEAGRVIQPRAGYATNPHGVGADGECPSHMNQGAPRAGRAQSHVGVQVDEQYEKLAPGRYSFTVTYCVQGTAQRLISNAISFEVEESQNP